MKKKSTFGMLWTIAVRNVGRNRRRTGLCVLAAGIAVFFCIFMQSWVSGMMLNMDDVIKTFDTGEISVYSKDFMNQSDSYPMQYPVGDGASFDDMKARFSKVAGVTQVFPRITAYATLQSTTIKNALVWGLEIAEETAFQTFNKKAKSSGLVEGRFPARYDGNNISNECAVGVDFAKKAGLKVGDSILMQTVSAQFSDKLWNPKIVGLFSFDYRAYDEGVILVDFYRLQRLLDLDDGTQQIAVYTANDRVVPQAAADIKALVSAGDAVKTWQDNYMVALMREKMNIFYVVYLVFMIVASFLIVNTVVMVIHERIKEIGMMGALGMSRAEITGVFFLEALVISILGSLSGVALGAVASGLGAMFPMDLTAFTGGGMKDYPMSSAIFMEFSGLLLLQGFLFGVIVSGLCVLFPSLKSAFIEPVEALRR